MINRLYNKAAQTEHKYYFLLLIAVFFLLYNWITYFNFRFFRVFALDYGYHIEAMYDFARFQTSPTTLLQRKYFFSVHPSFTMWFFIPFYWMLDWLLGNYFLLFMQNVIFIGGGVATYYLIKDKSGNQKLALLSFVHYCLLWGHFTTLGHDYVDVSVAVSVTPVFILFFTRKKWFWAALSFLFVITTRENVALWMTFLIPVITFMYRKDKGLIKPGIIFTLLSISYFILLFTVIIPYFEDPNRTYYSFKYKIALGETPAEALRFLLTHPFEAVRLMFVNHLEDPTFDGIKTEFYIVFLLSGGLLLFKRPYLLIAFIPIILQKVYSDQQAMWGIIVFYAIEIVSVLSFFTFWELSNMKIKRYNMLLPFLAVILAGSVTVHILDIRKAKWYIKEKENFYCKEFYKPHYNLKDLRNALELVPKNVPVSGSSNIISYLSNREKSYLYPNIKDAEYLVLLKKHGIYPLNERQMKERIEEYKHTDIWEVIYDKEDVIVIKKSAY